jgi:ABC-2 type transport system ATP-binding protein
MASLILDKVSKAFNSFQAVDQVTLDIGNNSLFGLLGPNGAGKTTTMRMIMNIIVPDSGTITVLGKTFHEKLKNRIGYLPEERGLYPKMKLLGHLQFLGEMKGMSATRARKTAADWLDRFELGKWADKRIHNLSKGMQQKVQFIGAILHSPDLLIVDEPFSGLDPINTKFIKDILLSMKKEGKAILLSTHLMDQAEKLCDGICLINRGRVVVRGDITDIKRKYSRNSVLLEYHGDAEFVKNLPYVNSTNDYGNYMEIQLRDPSESRRFFSDLAKSDLLVRKFEISETSLNEIFIDLVGSDSR